MLKYVYLADLAYASAHGGTAYSAANWIFYNFGPWTNEVYQRIEPSLAAIHANRIQRQSEYEDRKDWVRWSLHDTRRKAELRSALQFEVRIELDQKVQRFKKDTPTLLDHVYKTPPMLCAAPNQRLDFTVGIPAGARAAADVQTSNLTDRQLKKLRERESVVADGQFLAAGSGSGSAVPSALAIPIQTETHSEINYRKEERYSISNEPSKGWRPCSRGHPTR
ncbi:MAG: hypothetical protein Q8Q73_06005 [Stagnimonas sp.]|nr:hypothetical protein [Stagnimonas sp.]